MASEHIITVTDDDSDSFYLGQINQRLLGMERVSAYPAGAPGNLATAIAIAHQLDGSISQVAIYHSLRLAFLTVITPSYFLCSRDSYHITSFWKLRFRDLDFAVGLDLVDDTGSKKVRVTIPGLLAGTIDAASINLSEIELINPPFFSSLLQ